MLRTVYYGPHEIKPWCPGTGYLDQNAKSLKSYRSREPHTVWQSLQPKAEDLGEYDLYICRFCFLYSSKGDDIPKHEKVCRYRHGPPGKLVYEDAKYRYYEVQVPPDSHSKDISADLSTDGNTAGTSRANGTSGTSDSSANGTTHATGRHATGSSQTKKPGNGSTMPSENEAPSNETNEYMLTTPEGTPFNSVKLYLQSLALFGGLFLDTKSICFCVDAFLFYTGVEKSTGMVAGFFSKERHSWHNYNLACIVIFPPWQRHRLGQRFISLSYLLSRLENRCGSPEKPLSTHGKGAYHRYWLQQFAKYAATHTKRSNRKFTLDEISEATSIDPGDLAEAMAAADAFNKERKIVKLRPIISRLGLDERKK